MVARNEPNTSAATSVADVSDRLLNIDNGTSGAGERCSMRTKTATSVTPPASKASVEAVSQPWSTLRLIAYTTSTRPAVTVAAPATSNELRADARPPGTTSSRATTSAAPIGTLMRNTQGHPGPVVRAPPAISPTVAAVPLTAPKTPRARLRD